MSLGTQIGIDPGSANTLVYVKNRGIALNEPSVVTFDKTTGKIIAVGSKAKEMIGRTNENIISLKPINKGAVSDFNAATALLKYAIKQSINKTFFLKPKTIIAIASRITQVEKRALLECAMNAGAKEACLIESAIACAVAFGIDIYKACGNMIVDIGAGLTEIAVISSGNIVVCETLDIAGYKIDLQIQSYIEKTYDMICGEITAEKLKLSIGSLNSEVKDSTYEICGHDRYSKLPKSVAITQEEVQKIISSCLLEIADSIKNTLEKCPAELAGDIIKNGIVLCGGSALLESIADFLSEKTKLQIKLADNPQFSVITGIGKIIEDREKYNNLIIGLL